MIVILLTESGQFRVAREVPGLPDDLDDAMQVIQDAARLWEERNNPNPYLLSSKELDELARVVSRR